MKKSIKNTLAFLFAIANINAANAQLSFQRTYGGTGNESVQHLERTADGGFLLVGDTYSYGAGIDDYYVVKTDAEGVMEWNTVMGGDIAEFATDFVETADGGYAIVGSTYSWISPMSENVMVIKIDSEGDLEWTRAIGSGEGSERGYSIEITADGGFIIGGLSDSHGAGGYDFYAVKLDEDGVTEWANTIGFDGNDVCHGIFQTEVGDYLAFGTGSILVGGYSVMVSRISAAGDLVWTRGLQGDELNLDIYNVIETSDNNYLLTGWENGGASEHNFLAVKLDSAANLLWSKSYGSDTDVEFSYGAAETADGGFLLSGLTRGFAVGGTQDAYVVKVDTDGEYEWSRTYGYSGEEVAIRIIENEDGTLAIAGRENTNGAGEWDMWFFQANGDGYIPCTDSLDPTAIITSMPETIVADIPLEFNEHDAAELVLWNSIPLTPSVTDGGEENIICLDSSLSIHESFNSLTVSLFPNPSNGTVQINLNSNELNAIQLMDVQGRLISFEMEQHYEMIRIHTNHKGLALLQIQLEDGAYVSKTIVFQN